MGSFQDRRELHVPIRVLKVSSLHLIIAWGNKLRNWFCLSLQTPGIPFIKLRVVETLVGAAIALIVLSIGSGLEMKSLETRS